MLYLNHIIVIIYKLFCKKILKITLQGVNPFIDRFQKWLVIHYLNEASPLFVKANEKTLANKAFATHFKDGGSFNQIYVAK